MTACQPNERAIKAVELRMQGQTVNRGLFDALVLAVADGDLRGGD